jgi:hypothetical protein
VHTVPRLLAASLLGAMCLAGCAHWFDRTDVSDKEPNCARECDANYSACTARGPANTAPAMTPPMCSGAYATCMRRCPAK